MKKYSSLKNVIFLPGLTLIFILSFLVHGIAQDTVKKESTKTITLKIVTDENGKTTIIDTTFNSDSGMDSEQMKALINEMKDVQVEVGDMDFKFNMPCPPDIIMHPEEFADFDWKEMVPETELRHFRFNHGGQTLSDVLGDIPMERVKSYSVKEKKGWKRIIIDVNEASFPDHNNGVIVIRKKDFSGTKNHGKKAERKIIIRSEQTEEPQKTERPEQNTPKI